MAVILLLLAACEAPVPHEDPPPLAPNAVFGGEEVVYVGQAHVFDVGGSAGASFEWDFGDGVTGGGGAVRHTYEAPGRYTVRLTAIAEDGRTDIASATVVAVREPMVVPPSASSRLAYRDGTVYAVLPDEDAVVVVRENAVVDRLAVCGHPVALAAAESFLAVACRDDAVQLWATDGELPELAVEVPFRWGARPMGVAIERGRAVVALAGTGELVLVSMEEGSSYTVETLATVEDARAVATTAYRVYAPRFRSPDAGGEVQVYSDGALVTLPLAPDPGPDSDTDARGVPTMLGAVAVRPDGGALIVAGSKANVERGLQRDGLPYTFETATRSALRSIDAATGEPLERALFDNRDLVGAVAFTPLGDKLLVAHLGAGIVDVLDPFTLTRLGGYQGVGVGLDGLATDGETAWVLASVDKELVAYDLRAGNAEVELARISLTDTPVDLGARVFHFAGDPRMSQDAYLSCASCHLDGGNDGRIWDFTDRGEGFRDTQALFALPQAGPFHWSANFDEVQDFENAIRAHQSGTGFLADDALTDPLGAPKAGLSPELDALAEYVRSFPVPRSPWRSEDGSWTPEAERGRALFTAQGCDTCHAGPELTDAAWVDGAPVLHDVGTLLPTSGSRAGEPLTGLRTPSLRGLFATAPYLHDGRAATIEDALELHGFEADPDLVRYLLEIEDAP